MTPASTMMQVAATLSSSIKIQLAKICKNCPRMTSCLSITEKKNAKNAFIGFSKQYHYAPELPVEATLPLQCLLHLDSHS